MSEAGVGVTSEGADVEGPKSKSTSRRPSDLLSDISSDDLDDIQVRIGDGDGDPEAAAGTGSSNPNTMRNLLNLLDDQDDDEQSGEEGTASQRRPINEKPSNHSRLESQNTGLKVRILISINQMSCLA